MYKEARWESALIPSPLLPLGRKSDYTKSRRGKEIPKAVETCYPDPPERRHGQGSCCYCRGGRGLAGHRKAVSTQSAAAAIETVPATCRH